MESWTLFVSECMGSMVSLDINVKLYASFFNLMGPTGTYRKNVLLINVIFFDNRLVVDD
jgi:hypothetical protein